MGKIAVTAVQCNIFPGGWSIKPEQMFVALSNVEYGDRLRIIEFGAGAGTYALVELLNGLHIPYDYVSYETDASYVCKAKEVQTVLWKDFPTLLENGQYDLVIIDGPAGLDRVKWYPLLESHVHPGTILLVDDYRHFKEFDVALNNYFKHSVIAEDLQPSIPNAGQISWVVTRVTS